MGVSSNSPPYFQGGAGGGLQLIRAFFCLKMNMHTSVGAEAPLCISIFLLQILHEWKVIMFMQ